MAWCLNLWVILDAVQVLQGAEEEGIPRDRRRRPAPLTEFVLTEQFELQPRPQDERLPVLVQAEHLAFVGPRRRQEAARLREPLTVHLLAGLGVVTAQQAELLLQDVE